MRFLVLATFLGGCLGFGNSDSSIKGGDGNGGDEGGGGDGDGDGDNDDCKIEGEQIGEGGVLLRIGSKTVTFNNWIGKSDSPGEYVGFSLSLAGGSSVSYVVKAGGERHPSTATTW